MKEISFAYFKEQEAKHPGRRCFALNPDIHQTSADKTYFRPPFAESIKLVFEADTGIQLRHGQEPDNWYCYLDENQLLSVQNWQTLQGSRVFLRDCLSCSIALDHNFVPASAPQSYTQIGQLEHDAKKYRDEAAIRQLVDLYCEEILGLPSYADASVISAVPARAGKDFDLPTILAARIAERFDLADVTPYFTYMGSKGQLKETKYEERWKRLEEAQLVMSPEARPIIADRSTILIDDKYQSGVTANFVAMVLQQNGALDVFGLYAVKTWGDRDNS
jgi:hypothetical protein